MKKRLVLFSALLILSSAVLCSAKDSAYKNIFTATKWSTRSSAPAFSVKDYRNILDAAKWSGLVKGKALAALLKKKNAHGSSMQGFDDSDPEAMFPLESGCGWSCCFRTCVNSAMRGTSQTCIGSCITCGTTGSIWSCAMCASCGAVGFAAIEFCSLHCCVNPGC